MNEIVLLRHGRALSTREAGVHTDAERPLSELGEKEAREAAAYLKVSERQIRNFIARKLLRKSKAQAKTLIPGEDVETLLARTS